MSFEIKTSVSETKCCLCKKTLKANTKFISFKDQNEICYLCYTAPLHNLLTVSGSKVDIDPYAGRMYEPKEFKKIPYCLNSKTKTGKNKLRINTGGFIEKEKLPKYCFILESKGKFWLLLNSNLEMIWINSYYFNKNTPLIYKEE